MKLTTTEINEQLLRLSSRRLALEEDRDKIATKKRKMVRNIQEMDDDLRTFNVKLDKMRHEVALLNHQKELIQKKYDERVVERLLYRAGSALKEIKNRTNLTPEECRVMDDICKLFS